jgi:hypothetical protein
MIEPPNAITRVTDLYLMVVQRSGMHRVIR